MEETRKVLMASQMEAVRTRLRAIQKSCIPYSEFIKISQNKLMPLLTTLALCFLHIVKLSITTFSTTQLSALSYRPPTASLSSLTITSSSGSMASTQIIFALWCPPPLPPLPPVTTMQAKEGKKKIMAKSGISMVETRKLLRASQMKIARARLRAIQKSFIRY